MPKSQKQRMRENFRHAVFLRAGYTCECCGIAGVDRQEESDGIASVIVLDAHHITDRNNMPNGGYVKENGISLCAMCHFKAEQFHATSVAEAGFAPDDLYAKIGSSYDMAVEASEQMY
jgi:hypothetical protein